MKIPESFSIITPNLNSGGWLNLCIASVADQEGVQVEHLIQDAMSTDLDMPWISNHPRVHLVSESDNGMYDAINRGFKRAGGDIIAHLNADEQYLPGALKAVAKCFRENPQLDILFADTVIVDAMGAFICCRKSLIPQRLTRFVDNPTITSSIFMRRSAIERYQLLFDTNWRVLSDSLWIRSCLMQHGIKMAVLRRYTTSFTESGDNLDLSHRAQEESTALRKIRPPWAKILETPLKYLARSRRLLAGGFHQTPFQYQIYTFNNSLKRSNFNVEQPTCVWWTRAPRTSGKTYRSIKKIIGKYLGYRL